MKKILLFVSLVILSNCCNSPIAQNNETSKFSTGKISRSNEISSFPTGKMSINFVGLKDNVAIALLLNLVTDRYVEYNLEITVFGGQSIREQGRAMLYEYLSETKIEEQKYVQCDWVEFMSIKNETCKTHIKFAYHQESKKYIFAQLYQNCNKHTKDITFENFPVLWKK